MLTRITLIALLSISTAFAADDAKPLKQAGWALSVEAGGGGDSLEPFSGTKLHAGDGLGLMVGGFYRPRADSPLEIYGFAGYRGSWFAPVQGGGGDSSTLSSPVLEVLANYRFDNKWFVSGGLVSHLSPKFETNNADYSDIHFRTAVGATVEAGWSFIGVYYTYMPYRSSTVDLDGSSVGLRFTMRFRKWRPVH